MSQKKHWERMYTTKGTDQLGWYAPHLTTSLHWIETLGLEGSAPIIDIGGGASTLVDDLLDAGHTRVTVLDLSAQALAAARARLGTGAERVTWLIGDVTEADLPHNEYAVWHDRAVFHFLTTEEQRQAYLERLHRALQPGGHLIIGTFSIEAPPQCSGLPVQRYTAQHLARTLGAAFTLQRHRKELHVTPGGVEQMYLYCLFTKVAE